jgi:hypothetical protein
VVKSKKKRWAEHVVHVRDKAQRVLMDKPEEKY